MQTETVSVEEARRRFVCPWEEDGNAGLFGIHSAGGGAAYETDGTAVAAEVLCHHVIHRQ